MKLIDYGYIPNIFPENTIGIPARVTAEVGMPQLIAS